MKKVKGEIEEVILQALVHEARRDILRIIEVSEKGASYTELMDQLRLSTGKLNYHLKQLEGLIRKNMELRYVLTPLGRKTLNLLDSMSHGINADSEKFVKVAYRAQRRSLQPLIKSFIYIVMTVDFVAFIMTGSLAYLAFTEGAPAFVEIFIPVLLVMEIAFLIWLIYILKAVPEYVKRFERKVFKFT